MNVSLLVRHPNDPKRLYVNFDPAVLTLVREVDSFERIGFEVPAVSVSLAAKEQLLKANYSKLQVIRGEKKELIMHLVIVSVVGTE